MKAKSHFLDYGKLESRIANPFYLIKSFWIRLITICLYYSGIRIYEIRTDNVFFTQKLLERFLRIFVKWEFPFFHNLDGLKTKLYVTSWVEGGVEQAVNLYLKQDLKIYDAVIVIKSIKNVDAKNFPVFEVECVSRFKDLEYKGVCLIPSHFLKTVINSNFIKSVDIHHVFGFENMVDFLLTNYNEAIDFYFHDYYLFSDNWSFFGIPLENKNTSKDLFNSCSNKYWNTNSRALLIKRVNRIVATSYHSYALLKSQINFPSNDIIFEYLPEETDLETVSLNKRFANSKTVKVLILGNLGNYKGLVVLNRLVDLMSSNAMFSFHHIGGVSEGELHPSIQSFGWLEPSERNRQTELLNSDVALLISQCPETYCLVLSDLIRLRIPIIASKIGAITERLFDRENTVLVGNFEDAFSWVKALEEFGRNGYFDQDYDNLFQQEAKQIIKTKRHRNKSPFN
jgi:hypothetical protein